MDEAAENKQPSANVRVRCITDRGLWLADGTKLAKGEMGVLPRAEGERAEQSDIGVIMGDA